MKIKLKGRLISTKTSNIQRLKRIINICKEIKKTQQHEKSQWTNFVIKMLNNKLIRKVGSIPTKLL